MKLRIKGNSLRLRLLRGEVERFGETGRVSETVRFGECDDAQLTYVLEFDPGAREITAHFAANQITIRVPDQVARDWVESEEISLQSEQRIDDDGRRGESENTLNILIEKDFVCLDRRDDPDNADAYPHPTGKCG